MEEDGWREGSSEDKCALSFPSERNPLPEAHIYTDGNRRETTFLSVEKKNQRRGSRTATYQRNLTQKLTSKFGLEQTFCLQGSLIFKDALQSQEG